MNRRDGEASKGFHELPLVLFTAVAIAGAGIGAAGLGLTVMGWAPRIPPLSVRIWVILLLGFGLVVSTGHLGRPFRSPRALRRFGRSPLSNEVVLISVAMAACGYGVLFPDLSGPTEWIWVAGAGTCLLTLYALGSVYNLPGQVTWEGPVIVHPMILGMGFGAVALAPTLDPGVQARIDLVIFGLLALDALLVWARARKIARGLNRGLPSQPLAMKNRTWMMVFRMGIGVLVPALAVVLGFRPLALAALSLNLLFDRFLFYGLAVRHSTEAEVRRVEEALLRAESPNGGLAPGSSDDQVSIPGAGGAR